MVWQAEQRLRCSGCGHQTDETTQASNEGRYSAHKIVCHACAARDRRSGIDTNPGVYWSVEKGS